jgi:hypothetical protein
MALIEAAGYCKVHCRAEAEFPPPANVRFSVAVPLEETEVDERLKVCPRKKPVDTRMMMAPITGTFSLNTWISCGMTAEKAVRPG